MKTIDLACVIDDDKIYSFGIKKLMSITNFCKEVISFVNGKEALDYLVPLVDDPQALPDVILLDLNMPIIDGWQFLDEFVQYKLAKEVTIYIVSSSIDVADYDKAASYSVISNFYVKPVRTADLHEMMADFGRN
ncbi:MAG: response regulator [Pedobacter sp.]|nr:MAG: response regulator [Pedobacter sp.]